MFNLLATAMTLVPPVPLKWAQVNGRTQNALGQWVTAYKPLVDITGSWQPIDSSKYEELGLDLSKSHFMLYTQAPITQVERDRPTDQVIYLGRRYNVERDAGDWLSYDGWRNVVCIDVGPA